MKSFRTRLKLANTWNNTNQEIISQYQQVQYNEYLYFQFPQSGIKKKVQNILQTAIPLSQLLSANQRFLGLMPKNFWQYDKHTFRLVDKFMEIGLNGNRKLINFIYGNRSINLWK